MFDNLQLGLMLLLVVTAAWLWARSRTLWRQSGLPAGNVIYTDAGAWFPNTRTLVAADVRLAGKPDYLVQQADGSLIPVELKSSRAPAQPREGHVLQLAAYCFLVEANYGLRPDYGILQYKDKAFAIDFTEDLEEDMLDLLAEMQEAMFEDEVDRDHNDWGRCARCGLRNYCYQRLA